MFPFNVILPSESEDITELPLPTLITLLVPALTKLEDFAFVVALPSPSLYHSIKPPYLYVCETRCEYEKSQQKYSER